MWSSNKGSQGLRGGGGSSCEPVSGLKKFPGSRELAGNFPGFGAGGRFLSLNLHALSVTYGQIPYATEQGVFNAQQGISSAQQGISSVETSAPFWRAPQSRPSSNA